MTLDPVLWKSKRMASQLDQESALYGFLVPREQWALYSHASHPRLRQGDKKGRLLHKAANTRPPTSFTMAPALQKLPDPLPRGPGAWRLLLLPVRPLFLSATTRESTGSLVGGESLTLKQRLGVSSRKCTDTKPGAPGQSVWQCQCVGLFGVAPQRRPAPGGR